MHNKFLILGLGQTITEPYISQRKKPNKQKNLIGLTSSDKVLQITNIFINF